MYPPTTFVIDHDQANVSFTRAASTAQLDSIRELMAQRGAELVYTSIKKDGDKLSELSFTLSYGGHTGSAKTNFVNLRKALRIYCRVQGRRAIPGGGEVIFNTSRNQCSNPFKGEDELRTFV